MTNCRVYNSIANTSKGVLFLPPSDAYVRSFLYLLYTLIKLYYTKALSIKPLAPDCSLPVMYGCERWTIKKAECQRFDAFELWCWRRFLRVPWTARRANQSILKEISPEYALEGLMANTWPPDEKN